MFKKGKSNFPTIPTIYRYLRRFIQVDHRFLEFSGFGEAKPNRLAPFLLEGQVPLGYHLGACREAQHTAGVTKHQLPTLAEHMQRLSFSLFSHSSKYLICTFSHSVLV